MSGNDTFTPVCPRQSGVVTAQRGVALITALLVVSLATVAAIAMATRQHVDVRRTGNLLHGEQAYAYALAAESWALVIMDRDAEDSDVDMLEEAWATALPPISVEGGFVEGHITDLQGRFNINNLIVIKNDVRVAEKAYLGRLLQVLGQDPGLVNALIDWMDADINASYPDGAEDDTYLLENPPYRAANRPVSSASELGLVKGFDAEVMAALAPHITAVPVYTGINVNTATAEVLRALHEDLSDADVETLINDRGEDGYEGKEDFIANDAMAGLKVDVAIDVKSNWFNLQTNVQVGRGRARLESRLLRDDGESRVVSRIRSRQPLIR